MLVLLTALFGTYLEMVQGQKQAELTQEELYQWMFLDTRLHSTLAQALPPEKGKENSFFYTTWHPEAEGPTIVFSFEHKTTLDPLFSGQVLARLYVNRQKQLVLAIWPWIESASPPSLKMHHEVLMENVDSIAYSFYSPPDTENPEQIIKTREIEEGKKDLKPPSDSWLSEWKRPYKSVPPLVTIHLFVRGKAQTLTLFLPRTSYKVVLR